MAEMQAFRGVRYRLRRPEDAAEVVCPPYDVISPAQRALLSRRHPQNVVHLELPEAPEGGDRYQVAAALFQEWQAADLLERDPAPCLYVYGQRYQAGGQTHERLGLLGALGLAPYSAGVVLPHEQTFPKHREDRFRLLTAAGAQFSPIFGLYSAPEQNVRPRLQAIADTPPAAVASDADGVEHRLWPVADPDFAAWFQGVLAGERVYIADGHHRYETALRFQRERNEDPGTKAEDGEERVPSDYVMTFLVEMEDPGLVLLPTHRLVRGPMLPSERLIGRLSAYFRVEPVAVEQVDSVAHHQIGLLLHEDGPGSPLHAVRLTLAERDVMERLAPAHTPAWRDLDVAVLHRLVLAEALEIAEEGRIEYTRDPAEARARVQSGEFALGFFLPTPTVAELRAVAGAGDKMPQKSTYFWPKAITGLVIYAE